MKNIFVKAIKDNRTYLYEHEAYDIFKSFGIDLPFYTFVKKDELSNLNIDKLPKKLVVKAVARDLFHKTRVGGVKFIERDELVKTCKSMESIDKLLGYLIVEQVNYTKSGVSDFFILSLKQFRDFGLLVNFGIGGTETEVFAKHSKGSFTTFSYDDNSRSFLDKYNWPWKYLTEKHKTKVLEIIASLFKINEEMKKIGFEVEELEINPIAFVHDMNIVPLDAVFRFREYKGSYSKTSKDIDTLFFPKTVAIAGVSSKHLNMGRIILHNFIEKGFDKSNLYVVKPNEEEIDGVSCVASVLDLKDIDLLVLAVKSEIATTMIENIAEHNGNNIKNIVLIPGGFAETVDGKEKEKRIKDALDKSNINLVGGNCLGIISKKGLVDTFFIPKEKLGYANIPAKPYAFISQSGAFIISKLSKTGMVPLYAVSLGNQTGLLLSDYLEYFINRTDINTIALYIEGFKPLDGIRVVNLIKKTNKRVIVYKAGRTKAGQKAVGGHTASITSDYGVSVDLLTQAGAIVVSTLSEYEDLLKLSLLLDEYAYTGKRKLKDFKLFILANAGFETVSASDNIKEPLSLADASWVQAIIEQHKLTDLVNVNNPLDLTPSAGDEAYISVIKEAQQQDDIDFLIVSAIPMTPTMKSLESELDASSVFSNISKFRNKPTVLVVDSGDIYNYAVKEANVVSFREIDRVLIALRKILNF